MRKILRLFVSISFVVSLSAPLVDASFCGKTGVPYSFEVLQSGAPVLGCAQPSCVVAPIDDAASAKEDSEFLTDVNGQPDGFFRDGDRKIKHYRNKDAPKLIANCSGGFNELSCPKKNQWVGGIEYIDHPRQPLILQCCTFAGLRFSQEVGSTTVSAGEAITGGEVIRNGRQISFDVIANVRKVVKDTKIGYEVTVRRMNCLPDPPEPEISFEEEVPSEVYKVLSSASNKDLGTSQKFEKKESLLKGDKKSKSKAAPNEQVLEPAENAAPAQVAQQGQQFSGNNQASIPQQQVQTSQRQFSPLPPNSLEQQQTFPQQQLPEVGSQAPSAPSQQVGQTIPITQSGPVPVAPALSARSGSVVPVGSAGFSAPDGTAEIASTSFPTLPPFPTFPTLPPHTFPTFAPHTFPTHGFLTHTFPTHTFPPHTFPPGFPTFPPFGVTPAPSVQPAPGSHAFGAIPGLSAFSGAAHPNTAVASPPLGSLSPLGNSPSFSLSSGQASRQPVAFAAPSVSGGSESQPLAPLPNPESNNFQNSPQIEFQQQSQPQTQRGQSQQNNGAPEHSSLPSLVQPPAATSVDAQLRNGVDSSAIVPPQTGAIGAGGAFGAAGPASQPDVSTLPTLPTMFPTMPTLMPTPPPAMGTILTQLTGNVHPIMLPGLGIVGYSNAPQKKRK